MSFAGTAWTPAVSTRRKTETGLETDDAQAPRVVRTISALRRALVDFGAATTVALVPTMGALHAGHLRWCACAQARADRVVVSIFVNPAQFAPNEDFAQLSAHLGRRPRGAGRSSRSISIWAPSVATMYPDGFATRIVPGGPAMAGLEDKFRPHFFGGVATVVAKLLLQVQPDFAMFGEKDYQQLKVVTADGARPRPAGRRSSACRRCARRTASRCRRATPISRRASARSRRRCTACCKNCARAHQGRRADRRALAECGRARSSSAGFALDYLEARHAETLAPVDVARGRTGPAAGRGEARQAPG